LNFFRIHNNKKIDYINKLLLGGKYGLIKGNTLKVDVVGENTKRRRLIVVKLFLGELVNNNSGEKYLLMV
jgi:TRAP-type mannitol/chloroaromatic compound transport system permease small subunit